MSTIDIINDIKNEAGSKLTPAQICYEIKKAAGELSEDKIKSYQNEKPLTADEKKEAMDAIGSFLAKREADNLSIPELSNSQETANNIENSENKPQIINKISNKKEQSTTEAKIKESEDSKTVLPSPTNDEVKIFIVPVIADKIITNGKDGIEPDTVTYDSDNFTAMLRLGDEEQVISLDRKNTTKENTNALVATKNNNQQEYQIIINNINREEFERFKALFDKASQKTNASKEQNRDDIGGELG